MTTTNPADRLDTMTEHPHMDQETADRPVRPRGSGRLLCVAPYVLLPVVVFILVPILVLSQSEPELATFHPAGFLLLAVTSAVFALALFAISRLEARLTNRRFFQVTVEFVLFFVLITGFLLPASATSAMLDPEHAPADPVHVIVALLVAFVLLILARTRMRSSLYAAIAVFLIVAVLPAVPALSPLISRSSASTAPADAGIYTLSADRNVLVMSFDGVPGPAILEALESDPELKERFGGFTLYAGATATSTSTVASIATSLYGNQEYKARYPTTDALWDSDPDRLLTNRLAHDGWLVSAYGEYGRDLADPSRAYVSLTAKPPGSVFRIINYGIVRTLTSALVVGGSAGNAVDDAYGTTLSYLTGTGGDLAERFVAPHVQEWKRGPLTTTLLDLEAYLHGLRVGADRPVAHFLHFTHTHFPVEFDRDCTWASRDREWFLSHQDWDGVVEQAHCALTQMAQYLDELRTLGIYDESLIVLKSDHGEPVNYNDPERIESFPIRDHPSWGYGRYAPFLAIKDFGPPDGELRMDDHPVMLDDVPRTLCLHAGIDADCDAYGGYDLLGHDWAGIEDDEVTLFVVAGPESTYSYDTHVPLTIKRGERILDSLHDRLVEELLTGSVSCGQTIDVGNGAVYGNGRSDRRSWLTWRDRGTSFMRFGLAEPCGSMTLLIGDPGQPVDREDIRVVVDGQVVEAAGSAVRPTEGETVEAPALAVPMPPMDATGAVTIEVRWADDARPGAVPISGVVLG